MLVLALQFSRDREERHRSSGGLKGLRRCRWLPQNRREDAAPSSSRRTGELNLHRSTSTRTDRQCTNWECLSVIRPMAGGEVVLLRKEVIQPHLPVRLPCYDFTPITDPTFDSSLLAVGPLASGVADFRGVTGGVYKARERIHPGIADPGLLATPTSWSRVADSNPN